MDEQPLNPNLLLEAYANCFFPMGDDDGSIDWYDPTWRGVFIPHQFHVPRSARRYLNNKSFTVEVNRRFVEVMVACGSKKAGRYSTWINKKIIDVYSRLHELGHAHSVEVIRDDLLVGGLYGVSLGGAFFGESMFSFVSGGSKIALVHTAARLAVAGFDLFDAQYHTPHLAQFGCEEMHRRAYKRRLKAAIRKSCTFPETLSQDELQAFVHRG